MPDKAITAGDLAHARTGGYRMRVSAALEVIARASEMGQIGLSFSGGKDSTVTLNLIRQIVPDAPAAFFDSGCEYPDTYVTIEHYGAITIKPEMSLPEMCRYGGYWGHQHPTDPDAEFDFFSFLVAEPSWRFVTQYSIDVLAMGLRGQESKGRLLSARKRGELYHVKRTGIYHLCPLARWTDDDVWAHIASENLRYNEAYDRMAHIGIPRERWRVGMLLGMAKPGLQERYSWLRQMYPGLFYRLAADFPKIASFT